LLAVGVLWGARTHPGLLLWAVLVFVGYTVLPLSLPSNPLWNIRTQLVPTSFVVLIAAGSAPAWMAMWRRHRRTGIAVGASLLAALAAFIVIDSKSFVTEIREQQLEWAFLDRTVSQLPRTGTLLTAVETSGRNLDAFPQFLFRRDDKSYRMVDVRRAARGEEPWPSPADDLLFYQGMYCYFAFPDEASPDPMTDVCASVHRRYAAEALAVEELDSEGYSPLIYAPGPFRIGFFRLRERS
jgi:hypothetical protein